MKFYDLFSGIGGFRIGMERADHQCVGWCEIDKYARQVYEKQFGRNPKGELDARKIIPKELPDFDLLCAGFPCQTFSIAGRRLGFEESRGTLFFEIARIAKQKRPRLLLLENVKGLLSHDNGKTFAEILATLDELGYDAQWQVLNSKYFVPQNRERIFIIANLREKCRPEVFPLGEIYKKTNGDEPKLNQLNKPHHSTNRVYDSDGIARTLKSNTSARTGLYAVVNDHGKLKEVEKSSNLHPNYWKGVDSHAARTMIAVPVQLGHKGMNGRRFKTDGEPTFTITKDRRSGGISDGNKIRRLTPTECERLQGFPDKWTEGVSDTQRYRQLGNAVTVPVVEYILERLN